MTEDLSKALLPGPGEAIDPVELARRDQKKHLPRRFWKETGVAEDNGRFALTLDGRRAKTPGRADLVRAHARTGAGAWRTNGRRRASSSTPPRCR